MKNNFDKLIKKYSHIIERELEKIIKKGVQIPNLHNGLSYALGLDIKSYEKRGKRIRPILCLMTCESLGGQLSQAIFFATAIELMHNFCLIHDDIEDGDKFRRDRPCVYIKYGLPHGINIGDYMFTKIFAALLIQTHPPLLPEIKLRLIKLMTDVLDHTHIGQALDINARFNRNFTVKDYFKIVTEKTGYYLSAPILGGAIIAGASNQILEAIENFGKYVGPLFQIVDDLIDLTVGKGRKEIGSDIKEGKRSFLVAHASSRCSPKEKKHLFDILDKPREKTTIKDINWVKKMFEKTDSIQAGKQMGEWLLGKCKETLKDVPPLLRNYLQLMAEKMFFREK